ncbi:hypothetical protein FACS18949_02400 [Clostridia bacterium]|nr:hypothetical protein FACS18949_02400 [Clostridia bacterium]
MRQSCGSAPRVFTFIPLALFAAMILFLAVDSLFTTAAMTRGDKVSDFTIYKRDFPPAHILTYIAACAAVYFVARKVSAFSTKHLLAFLSAAVLAAGFVFITFADVEPAADGMQTLACAQEFVAGDYGKLQPNKYLGFYPQQLGLTWYFSLFAGASEDGAYIIIQYVNLIYCVICLNCLVLMTKLIFANPLVTNLTALLTVCFVPFFMYATFVYGNIAGFCFALLAMLFQLMYLKNHKIIFVIFSVAFITFSVLIRKNFLIVLVALVIFYLLDALRTRKWLRAVPAAAAVFFCLITGNLLAAYYASASGIEPSAGVPNSAFIAMGLQEGPRAQGWYNSYNYDIYADNGYNSAIASEKSAREIKDRLKVFARSPRYALDFFYHKLSSMWNNPDFQAVHIITSRPNKAVSSYAGRLLLEDNNKLHEYFEGFMNLFQSLILLGTAAFIAFNFKKLTIEKLYFAVVFIGVFLFHIFWEAKGQYVFTAFFLLMPYAAAGLSASANALSHLIAVVRAKALS